MGLSVKMPHELLTIDVGLRPMSVQWGPPCPCSKHIKVGRVLSEVLLLGLEERGSLLSLGCALLNPDQHGALTPSIAPSKCCSSVTAVLVRQSPPGIKKKGYISLWHK